MPLKAGMKENWRTVRTNKKSTSSSRSASNSNGSNLEQLQTMDSKSIFLQNVSKIYRTPAGDFSALNNVNLNILAGEFVSVVGQSGSGKSTLLNMITGIDYPSDGDILVGGMNIRKLNESQRALWRGKNVGIVFQFFQLLPMLTLLENVMLPMDYTQVIPKGRRTARALDLLEQVDLQEHGDKLPAAVSGGQQQSAAIARALATDPPIIVADEPTGNLDSRSAGKIIDLFDNLVEQGKTILIVTHDPSITQKTDRTLIISDGKIVDETVAKALPLLSHRQMLDISQLIHRRTYQPGEEIIQMGQPVGRFFMIVTGEVEIGLRTRRCPDLTVAMLGPGEFFGEIELLKESVSVANVRASRKEPVELLELPRDEFMRLLADSSLTEQAILKVVQSRLSENRQMRKKCR